MTSKRKPPRKTAKKPTKPPAKKVAQAPAKAPRKKPAAKLALVRDLPAPLPRDVIALSPFRARLARGRRIRRGDELLDADDPEAAVRAVPPDEFFYLLTERGFPEANELLVHASVEQVQVALDFALWDRDRVSPAATTRWLAALAEAESERIFEWMRGLDVELLALVLRQSARFYNLGLEMPPDDPVGNYMITSDGAFEIDLLGDEDQQRTTRRLVETLYQNDLEYARHLLVGLGGESDSELEEFAYRWRSGRMQDLGFADDYEALEIYQDLDPASVRIGEGRGEVRPARPAEHSAAPSATDDSLRVPGTLVDSLQSGSRFARAVAGVTESAELSELHADLVSLVNRAFSADRVRPGDEERQRESLLRMQANLDLALDYLTRDVAGAEADARATAAVRTIGLTRLFRLGFTLVAKVGRLASTLLRRNSFITRVPEADLFEPHDADILDALARPRPVFPQILDALTTSAGGTRAFASLADLARAGAALEQAAAALAMVVGLGVRPETLVPERWEDLGITDIAAIDAAVLARTALVLRLLGVEAGFRALSTLERERFHGLPAADTERAFDILRGVSPARTLSPAAALVARRWVDSLSPLEPVLVLK